MKATMVDMPTINSSSSGAKTYRRFDISQRIEHVVLLVTFTILALTGLPQKFATYPVSELIIKILGGIEMTRLIHRLAATFLMAESIYHLVGLLYRVFVKRISLTMLPGPLDIKHVVQDVLFYLGIRKRHAYYGRYSYAEKAEYMAVIWGTVVMAITGFMMWNPIATAQLLPGEIIPAAKAAHGGEALLAVLSIILWHFYHVHIRHFNRSMFTGILNEEEMKKEHPAELALLTSGKLPVLEPTKVLQRRQLYFFPAALVITGLLSFGVYEFVTFEKTAIHTVPRGETAPIFMPITPTPSPTPFPTATPPAGEIIQAISWEGGINQLFLERCSTCHGMSALGGLNLTTYQDAMKGSKSGVVLQAGDPQGSLLVQIQSTGNHPGLFTERELLIVIGWVEAGMPEK